MGKAYAVTDKAKIARLIIGRDASLCYGVGCPKRGRCARYLAIDAVTSNDGPWQSYIESCQVGPDFSLFVSIQKED